MSNIRQFILDYIQTEYSIPADIDAGKLNFVETGYVDSVGMIRFVVALEEEFDIEFNDDELSDPAFKVVGALEKMIEQKIGCAK